MANKKTKETIYVTKDGERFRKTSSPKFPKISFSGAEAYARIKDGHIYYMKPSQVQEL